MVWSKIAACRDAVWQNFFVSSDRLNNHAPQESTALTWVPSASSDFSQELGGFRTKTAMFVGGQHQDTGNLEPDRGQNRVTHVKRMEPSTI